MNEQRAEDSGTGDELPPIPDRRSVGLVDEAGVLVATGNTTIEDSDVFALIDTGRR